jgi:CheY-like chemotaxis protein
MGRLEAGAMTARRVIAVVPDLFFATRIAGAAARLDVALEQPDPAEALAAIRRAPPDLVILDLATPGDPLALALSLRADPSTRAVPIVGFYPHVDGALRARALAAGLDQVLPRSAFTARLAAILEGGAADTDTPGPP